VDENESVRRQLRRGTAAVEHNQRVRISGEGKLVEERATDFDEALIRKRYSIFKQHYHAMLGLKERFQFHLIDASNSLEAVRNTIMREFEYQSSLELGTFFFFLFQFCLRFVRFLRTDQNTHDLIQHIPLASEIGTHSRQDLVRRLDNYQMNHSELFKEAVQFISSYFVPAIKRQAIGGRVLCRVDNQKCLDPIFVEMLLDILYERGYHVNVDSKISEVPRRIDSNNFQIIHDRCEFLFYLF